MKDSYIAAALLALTATLATAPAGAAQEPRIIVRSGPTAMIGIGYDWRPEQRDGRTEQRLIVRQVLPGSPAEDAGVQPGDAVLRLNGLTATPDLMAAIGRSIAPGDTVRMSIRRDDTEHELRLIAAARANEHRAAGWPAVFRIDADSIRVRVHHALDSLQFRLDSLRPLLRADLDGLPFVLAEIGTGSFYSFDLGRSAVGGAELTELNADLARHFPGAADGLLVLRVAPESPAARAGLKPGDVVIGAGGTPVRSVRDLRRAVSATGREPITLEIVRDGARREIQMSARQSPAARPPASPRSRDAARRPLLTAPSTVGATR